MHVQMRMKMAAAVPWLAFAWTILASASSALAQEEKPKEKPPKESSSKAAAFFQSDLVDFWGEGKKKSEKKLNLDPEDSLESIWAEPIRTPDGRFTTYVPPKKVLAFLENPTRETARDYVAWQEERMKKLKAAVDVLRELQEEKRGSKPEAEPKDERTASTRAISGEVLYFKKANCPWCAEEDKALAALLKANPGISVRMIQPGEAPELWKEFGVTAVPTLVLSRPGGKETRKTVVRGFLPSDQLARILMEVNRDRK